MLESDGQSAGYQVLNPMSHAPAMPLAALEVQEAINSAEALVTSLQKLPK